MLLPEKNSINNVYFWPGGWHLLPHVDYELLYGLSELNAAQTPPCTLKSPIFTYL